MNLTKRVLPYAEFAEIERAAVGALLNGAEIGGLIPEDFHEYRHLFEEIRSARESGGDVDLITTANKTGLDLVELVALLESGPEPQFASRYIKALSEVEPMPMHGPRVLLRSAADIQPAAIRWLWPGWLACGKLHILAGAPGTGKSTLAFSLASILSNAGVWPDGSQTDVGQTVIWSGEDEPGDTIIPRLIACGADRKKIQIVDGVMGENPRPFDPALDMTALHWALKGRNVRLLIVDPVVSAVSGDSHKNTEVRRGLQPLVDMAAATGCAVLGISHFTKNSSGKDPIDRVTGSLAFGALARVVLATAKLPEDEHGGARLLARAKSNIGPDSGGVLYHLEQTTLPDEPGIINTKIIWGKTVEGSARDLLAQADQHEGEEKTATDEARDWLVELLRDGPMRAGDIQREAKNAGISYKSLRRAKDKLRVKTQKQAFSGGWEWCLPEDAPAPRCPEDSPTQKKGALELLAQNTKAPPQPPYLSQEFQDALKSCSGTFGASSQNGYLRGNDQKTAEIVSMEF